MTWDEFKAAVEEKLRAEGLDGSTEIWYIDFSSISDPDIGLEPIGDSGPLVLMVS